jgi:hypothetical protein
MDNKPKLNQELETLEDNNFLEEQEEPLSFKTSKEDFVPKEDNTSTMRSFFSFEQHLFELEMHWKGFTKVNGDYIRNMSDIIGPDSFINELINSIRSVCNQTFSVSTKTQDEACLILWEKFKSFNEHVRKEPFFNWTKYSIIKEEYDHTIELFMGLVINGHGTNVATSLQAGVVAESLKTKPQENVGILDPVKNILFGEKKQ